jgi:hypothetical protein
MLPTSAERAPKPKKNASPRYAQVGFPVKLLKMFSKEKTMKKDQARLVADRIVIVNIFLELIFTSFVRNSRFKQSPQVLNVKLLYK